MATMTLELGFIWGMSVSAAQGLEGTSIELSRRSFLGGAVAITALAAMPPVVARLAIPTLYGDCIRDDTLALQALLDGNPVIMDGEVVGQTPLSTVSLNGAFRISDTLRFRRSGITLRSGMFLMDWDDARPFLEPMDCSHTIIRDTHWITKSYWALISEVKRREHLGQFLGSPGDERGASCTINRNGSAVCPQVCELHP